MTTLITDPHLADPDGFYEALIHSQRDLDAEQAALMNAKLVLILANHIGDRAVLDQAIALAEAAWSTWLGVRQQPWARMLVRAES